MKNNNEKWNLQNTYSNLPDCFYEKIKPTLVQNPKIIYFNKNLAKNLNLEFLNKDSSLIYYNVLGVRLYRYITSWLM